MQQWISVIIIVSLLLSANIFASDLQISNCFKEPLQFQNNIYFDRSVNRWFQSAGRNPRILSNGVAVPSDFPEIHTCQYGQTAPGRIFFSSTFFDGSGRGNYLVICENDGTPYFYRRYDRSPDSDKGTADFRVQENGLLTFHQYLKVESGIFYIMDQTFTHIDTFICGDQYWTDNHEFLILPNGHALLIAEEIKTEDLSNIPGGHSNARVIHNYIQELDSDGRLYWEWSSADRLDIEDAVEANLATGWGLIDYVHVNSIAKDYDGHYIISLRYYNEVAKINSSTGNFIWRLGGENNQFTFINENTQISSQHHARPVPGKPNHYTIYDNGDSHTPPFTRAVEYKIDPVAMTAEKVWEYRYDKVNYAFMMGSVQRLSNGNTYIDWSTRPPMRACEVDSNNNLLFEIEVDGVSGYRSYRCEWEGKALKPELIAENHRDAVFLIFNQFNDPDVDYFNIYHDTSPHPTTLLDTSRLTMKNFDQLENKKNHYFRVTSVDQSGKESGFSNEEAVFVKNIAPGENQIINPDFTEGDTFWTFGTYGDISASGAVVDGVYRLRVTDVMGYGGANVFQSPVELLENATYIFEFAAWSDQKLQIQPYVMSGNASTDYSRIGSVQVTEENKVYSFEFTKSRASTTTALAGFLIETNTGTLYIDYVSLKQVVTSVSDKHKDIPVSFQLGNNYPNPFNSITTLPFTLSETSEVVITLYDIQGKQISSIHKGVYDPGEHRVIFQDELLSSGVYFFRMEARSAQREMVYQRVRKIICLK
ncbi:aryl-sulfate sulfotransferase [bacterium]|nr:aryl-sulfate sulfotransferase [bacterium]